MTAIGGEDLVKGAAWASMIEGAQAAGAKVILLAPTPDAHAKLADPNNLPVQPAAQVRQLAADHGTGLADPLACFQAELARGTPPDDLLSQFNHPNARGPSARRRVERARPVEGQPGILRARCDGQADLLVDHARSYRDIKGHSLHEGNRHTRIQKITWRTDGSTDFGVPTSDSPTK